MDWTDQPAGAPAPATPPSWSPPAAPSVGTTQPAAASSTPSLGGAKRLVATAVLAVGLLGVGGAAVAFAADPSATPAPSSGNQSQPAQPGTNGGGTAPMTPGARPNGQAPSGTGHAKGDCPNMGGSGGAAPNGPAAPSTNGSTSSPSTSDL